MEQPAKDYLAGLVKDWTDKFGIEAFDSARGISISFYGLEFRQFLNALNAVLKNQSYTVAEVGIFNDKLPKVTSISKVMFEKPITVTASPKRKASKRSVKKNKQK